jgi:organic radical activating enzyme
VKVVEIFSSIEGEGAFMGLSALFIRFFGCNLRCAWCDTKESYDDRTACEELEVADIVRRASERPSSLITITGGEPFMQRDLLPLCEALLPLKRRIKVETNGTIFADLPREIFFAVSPKPPNFRIDRRFSGRIGELKFVVDAPLESKHILAYRDEIKRGAKVVLQIESSKKESLKKALLIQRELLSARLEAAVLPQLHKIFALP